MEALNNLNYTNEEKAQVEKILALMKDGHSWKVVRLLINEEEYPGMLNAIEKYCETDLLDIYY